jgi:FKBP-type peptidyl-prolyl cis-trans isomerase
MKNMGMAILALGLVTCGANAQQEPGKQSKPATAPAQAPKAAPPPAAAQTPAAEGPLKTEKDKLSYAIGLETGKGIKAQGIDIDPDLLSRGLKDAMSGGKALLSDDELRQVITKLQQDIRSKQAQIQQATAAENKKKGEEFLAENAKKDGVVALPDGLQYKILTAGAGKKPVETDTVLCNYKGTFLDGAEFDSSARAGKPVPFELKNVIPGFKEVLQLMPVGSKWQVFVPSSLAYGERGAGNVIAPNSTLIFEIELVGIQDSPPAAKATPPAGEAPETSKPQGKP